MNREEQQKSRFEINIEEGSPHGDLYDLEQTTYYHVIDTRTKRIVMTFQGEMEASLSTSTGLWDDYQYDGVCEATISPDEKSIQLKYHNGHEKILGLPQ